MLLKNTGNIIIAPQSVSVKPLKCLRCKNDKKHLFYTYISEYYNGTVTYCMNCVQLGAMTDRKPLRGVDVIKRKERAQFILDFELSEIQSKASDALLKASIENRNILLSAVTGAGKTEITFQCIAAARQRAKRVAFIAPRIDVVKEIYTRLSAAFVNSRIDLKYDGVKLEFEHQFLVATVQQLYNYHDHFDLIIVDETDAFPLTTDDTLMQAIKVAATEKHSIIFMTATPSQRMLKFLGQHETVTINKRYHGHPLAIPRLESQDVIKQLRKNRINKRLVELLKQIVASKRKVLVFVPEIELMHQLETLLSNQFDGMTSVYSDDAFRYVKVEAIRESKIEILLTTTILERGVTFSYLDVIVIVADHYDSSSLMQICGRVGRKIDDPIGNIHFFTEFQTLDIIRTIKTIQKLNAEDL